MHTNDPNSYRCICDQGWTSNGTSLACTIDVNECETPMPHCSMDPEVPCINLPGSYTCGQCPHGKMACKKQIIFILTIFAFVYFEGFTGNGHYCKDIDECVENNGGCSMAPFVTCINTRVSSVDVLDEMINLH